MSRLLINLREVARKREAVIDSMTSSYKSTELETPVQLSSVVFEPDPNDIGVWATDRGRETEPQLVEHVHVLSTIAEDHNKSSADEIEMVERGV